MVPLVSTAPPSLDKTVITARQAVVRRKRSSRAVQRVLSGTAQMGRDYRFITLTSAEDSPLDFQKSWRKLSARLRRRGLLREYIKVTEFTQGGLRHAHIIYVGSYIDQAVLSAMWGAIHGARVVDIRALGRGRGRAGVAAAARYLGKYMSKDEASRLAYSRGWAFPRLAAYWKEWKHLGRTHGIAWFWVLLWWKGYCAKGIPPPILLPTPKRVGRESIGTFLTRRTSVAPQHRATQLELSGPGWSPGRHSGR